MSLLSTIFTTLVALEFFYIFYLETVATTSASTSRVFKMDQEELQRKSVSTLFKNQGVYNGLLAILLLVSVYVPQASSPVWTGLLLSYVVLVAAYGAMTSDKNILWKQGGIAILALISFFF